MNSGDVFKSQRLLLKKILERPVGYEWTVQGLGMMRLYLSDEVRIHLWHSSLAVPKVTEMHEHPWNFESLVLCGVMKNYRYFLSDQQHGRPYERDLLLCGSGNLADDPSPVWLDAWLPDDRPSIYPAGHVYSQRFDEIHRTGFVDGSATLVHRTFVNEDRDHAYVYWKRGERFVSAEPREATRREIITVAEAALGLLA